MKRKKLSPAPDAVAALIRTSRRRLGWSLAKLAAAAKLASPAYVFHIENGHKAPSESIAGRLARALGLDPELLRAWARARGRSDMATSLEAAAVLSHWLGERAPTAPGPIDGGEVCEPGVDSARAEPGGRWKHDDPNGHDRARPEVIDVPVLPEGADPAAGPDALAAPIETLAIDRRLFPPLAGSPRVVGYRLSAHGARRVADVLHPGDCAVVALGSDPPPLDALCAVRIGARVEIARVRLRDGAVHLPGVGVGPDSGAPDERIPADPAAVLVGRVVVAFRRWL